MNLTPERWQHVARIYEAAVDWDPATRAALLEEACAGDESLLRDVQSLLREDEAVVILDRPVWETAARLLQDQPDIGPGTVLGAYRIETFLGAGGMGEVFSAIDNRLHRRVAIKVLPSGVALDERARARFSREAEAVAALTHPHICTLYDVGRHDEMDFLVMEHLAGDTLAARLAHGPLPDDRALTYATQIASALDHAHRQGVIHRDLKPANIMLTAGGAKLLDFGVAKFRTLPGPSADETAETGASTIAHTPRPPASGRSEMDRSSVTRNGTILGTLRYMAPEQITGHEVDARSDLFSFGAVLHEMFSGRRAFEGDSASGVRLAILEHEPPPVSSLEPRVPAAIDTIVRRCLAKDPAERWQTADEVLRELQRVSESRDRPRTRMPHVGGWEAAILLTAIAGLGTLWFIGPGKREPDPGPASQIRSIAVLPLEDLSSDADEPYFADGTTDQLIADLAAIPGLRVISRTSVMRYRNARKPVSDIARELQVEGIIEGSVVRVGDTVRITAKLIRGATEEVLWARTFERGVRDVLALHREVARAVSREIDIALTPNVQARLAMTTPIDPEVHRQVLLGRHHTAKATEESLRRALEYFNAALAGAADNAIAYAGLAEAYMGLSGYYMHPREAMPKAKQAAETAIRLDESLADAHAVLGYIRLVYDWDGPAARTSLTRALELNPTLATARLHYAAYLTTQSRHDEAVREIRRALESDPVSIRTNAIATSLLIFARRFPEAIDLAQRGFEFEPNAFALAFQGVAYAEQGRFDQAVDNMVRAAEMDDSATILSLQAHVLALAGEKDEARRVIRRVEESTKGGYFCPYEIGSAHVTLGDTDTAYKYFRKGVEERADCMAWLGVEPWLDSFRSDPRYLALLRDIGLDPSVKERRATAH